ncbi:hypothetical protein KEJ15_02230 [Candidatus Bathyarchaeota archaeon]|nr:hypothetical protein [Candidatus Bathyarchaeota archaeon]
MESSRKVTFFCLRSGQRRDVTLDGKHFFLRTSVEYSNPQLTVEEVQGIIAARLLEVCGTYFADHKLEDVDEKVIGELCELLQKPPQGRIVPFLLNTDDVEPDRYSINPLKESIVSSGQSALPAASVKTEQLCIDQKFMQKYEGSLISSKEAELITRNLRICNNNYMNMVDAVKYEQLEYLSEQFGMDLHLCTLRMPQAMLSQEHSEGLLHRIIREAHRDYASIEHVYSCIGRSMKSRSTLLTVPHSSKGYGSKRAAKGKIYFDGIKLKNVRVDYETTKLYPNAIDPDDVSIAVADDHFTVEGSKLVNYAYFETPSSPQFFLYSLASPENAALWHGIGAFGASQLVKSYLTIRLAFAKGFLFKGLADEYKISSSIPLQLNLRPEYIWFHPVHRNIDASIGTVENLKDLAAIGMRLESLPIESYIRNGNNRTEPS